MFTVGSVLQSQVVPLPPVKFLSAPARPGARRTAAKRMRFITSPLDRYLVWTTLFIAPLPDVFGLSPDRPFLYVTLFIAPLVMIASTPPTSAELWPPSRRSVLTFS